MDKAVPCCLDKNSPCKSGRDARLHIKELESAIDRADEHTKGLMQKIEWLRERVSDLECVSGLKAALEGCEHKADVVKLAHALDYYREHYDDGRVAHAVLREVAGEPEKKPWGLSGNVRILPGEPEARE